MKSNDASTQEIREKAKMLGINKIGFAKVETLDIEGERLETWLRGGLHGTMKWMNTHVEKRKNPVEILADAKSVISIAVNYFHDPVETLSNNDFRLSRHVWGNDYHLVLKSILRELWDYILLKYPEAKGKIYVDAGPVMEKAWAIRAGIGWQGKHSITVTKEYGSWIFLGEIICNIEFDYDTPIENLCGDCRLCIDACPTNAIVGPYLLDATRCIAYQTIENEGDCDPGMRSNIGQWIYGCDICQEVCPWNSKSQRNTLINEFILETREKEVGVENFQEMDEQKFKDIFGNKSIRRISFDKFKRNIEIAVNNKTSISKE
jgi:epoxyqueuosine reductase